MDDRKLTRDERLAAKLRENLRLRKAQARAIAASDTNANTPRLSNDEGER